MSTNYITQITDTGGTTHDIAEGVDTRIFRGTCATAVGTSAKVVTLDNATNFSLAAGVRVAVTFTYGNTASSGTLKVGSTTAKTIVSDWYTPSSTLSTTTTLPKWGTYETLIFTYNGTYWVLNSVPMADYQHLIQDIVPEKSTVQIVRW